MKGKAMNKIGFDIGEESDQEEQQTGHVESDPVEEEDFGGYGYWLFRAGTDFLMVYGLLMGVKNVINFVRKE